MRVARAIQKETERAIQKERERESRPKAKERKEKQFKKNKPDMKIYQLHQLLQPSWA